MSETTTRPQGDDSTLARSLQRQVQESLVTVLQGAQRVALVDFPYHRNAGDAAIWAGERAALQAIGVEVGYMADAGRFDSRRLREAVPEGPVLLSGGGNVGDLWMWSQGLRERVLHDLTDRRVIQLCQSIHFRERAAEDRFADIVRCHGGYTFMARDEATAERARTLGPAEVALAPDMAFGLGPLGRRGAPRHPVLALARDDVEAASGLREAAAGRVPVVDWDLGRRGDLLWQATRTVPRLTRAAVGHPRPWRLVGPMTSWAMEAMCHQVLERGLALLSAGSVVVTDRLHAHILCTLLGVPHVVLDNSYGKISALHRAWTRESRTTTFAAGPDEALEAARRLAQAG